MRVPAVFALVVVIWSTTPLAAKWSIDSLSFITAAGTRMALGAVVCLMILRLRGVAVPWDAAALRSYAAAMVGVFGAMTSVYWAVQFIASGMISVIFGLAPIASGLLAAPLLGERSFSVGRLLAMIVSLAGLAVSKFNTMPRSFAPLARSACIAVPWASNTWCMAWAAARMSRRPGAWAPMKCDSQATHQGSLIVATECIRSPIRPMMTSAKSANHFATSGLVQPPRS